MTDEQKNPVDQALDLFVFAPIGLLGLARQELPKLVERGRQQVEGQLTMARMMGEFAVKQGRVEADKAIKDLADRFNPPAPAPATAPTQPAKSQPAKSPTAAKGPASGPSTNGNTATTRPATEAGPAAQPAPPATPSASAPPAAATPAAPRPDGEHLAIPGYDSLSASQVVPRLAGLAADELEAVRKYEEASRGRRTILNKVAQLQATAGR